MAYCNLNSDLRICNQVLNTQARISQCVSAKAASRCWVVKHYLRKNELTKTVFQLQTL